MKCCVLGLGYIGLPTAAILANNGHEVLGIDINEEVIKTLNSGQVHISEPGLDNLVKINIESEQLIVSKKIEKSDVFLITVPTPFKNEIHNGIPIPDISYVINAVNSICKVIKENDLIILESTSPVGTTEEIAKLIFKNTGLNTERVHIAYCPERVIPGNILFELVQNHRVVGGLTEEASEKAKIFYSTFCNGNIDITETRVAELVKLSENTFRDINIAFANELSMICDELDINPLEVIKFSNKHPRVNILKPGCGVGGHCIAVDPWFIASKFPDKTDLIQIARKVNLKKTKWVINKIIEKSNDLEKKIKKEVKVGILGLSFKPDVDDLRESPAKLIASELIKLNIKVIAYEPNIKSCKGIEVSELNNINNEIDLAVFLVAHKEFKKLKINKDKLDFCGLL